MTVSTNNFEYAMNLNARAFMLLMQEAAPLLKRTPDRPGRAKAISISSFGAVRALPMYGAIGATKAALEALTRHFALELGNDGINVNCIRARASSTPAQLDLYRTPKNYFRSEPNAPWQIAET